MLLLLFMKTCYRVQKLDFFHFLVQIQSAIPFDHAKYSCHILVLSNYRPHTTVKNARNMKSVSQAKPPYFEGIVKL